MYVSRRCSTAYIMYRVNILRILNWPKKKRKTVPSKALLVYTNHVKMIIHVLFVFMLFPYRKHLLQFLSFSLLAYDKSNAHRSASIVFCVFSSGENGKLFHKKIVFYRTQYVYGNYDNERLMLERS